MALSGNTCLQLSHIYVLWKHTIQLGKLLSKQCLLTLIKGNVFTILQIKKAFCFTLRDCFSSVVITMRKHKSFAIVKLLTVVCIFSREERTDTKIQQIHSKLHFRLL